MESFKSFGNVLQFLIGDWAVTGFVFFVNHRAVDHQSPRPVLTKLLLLTSWNSVGDLLSVFLDI